MLLGTCLVFPCIFFAFSELFIASLNLKMLFSERGRGGQVLLFNVAHAYAAYDDEVGGVLGEECGDEEIRWDTVKE